MILKFQNITFSNAYNGWNFYNINLGNCFYAKNKLDIIEVTSKIKGKPESFYIRIHMWEEN